MSVTLNQVIPWGRSLQEYTRMFNLSDEELNLRILGVGDGPASFNSEMNALGHTVLSIDPIYSFSRAQIEGRIEESYDTLISQVERKPDNFVWDFFSDPAHCGRFRLETMRKFLEDFEVGKVQGRYLPESLPTLNCSAIFRFSSGFYTRTLSRFSRGTDFPAVDVELREIALRCTDSITFFGSRIYG